MNPNEKRLSLGNDIPYAEKQRMLEEEIRKQKEEEERRRRTLQNTEDYAQGHGRPDDIDPILKTGKDVANGILNFIRGKQSKINNE